MELNALPDELLINIADLLGVRSLARFGRTNRKMQRLAHDRLLWIEHHRNLYGPHLSPRKPTDHSNLSTPHSRIVNTENWRANFFRNNPHWQPYSIQKVPGEQIAFNFNYKGRLIAAHICVDEYGTTSFWQDDPFDPSYTSQRYSVDGQILLIAAGNGFAYLLEDLGEEGWSLSRFSTTGESDTCELILPAQDERVKGARAAPDDDGKETLFIKTDHRLLVWDQNSLRQVAPIDEARFQLFLRNNQWHVFLFGQRKILNLSTSEQSALRSVDWQGPVMKIPDHETHEGINLGPFIALYNPLDERDPIIINLVEDRVVQAIGSWNGTGVFASTGNTFHTFSSDPEKKKIRVYNVEKREAFAVEFLGSTVDDGELFSLGKELYGLFVLKKSNAGLSLVGFDFTHNLKLWEIGFDPNDSLHISKTIPPKVALSNYFRDGFTILEPPSRKRSHRDEDL